MKKTSKQDLEARVKATRIYCKHEKKFLDFMLGTGGEHITCNECGAQSYRYRTGKRWTYIRYWWVPNREAAHYGKLTEVGYHAPILKKKRG